MPALGCLGWCTQSVVVVSYGQDIMSCSEGLLGSGVGVLVITEWVNVRASGMALGWNAGW